MKILIDRDAHTLTVWNLTRRPLIANAGEVVFVVWPNTSFCVAFEDVGWAL